MTRRQSNILILCIIGAAALSFTATQYLFWNKNYRLGFSDFKGSPTEKDTALTRTDEKFYTHTLGAISKSIDVKLVNKNGKTTFTIYAGMDQFNSWIKNPDDSITLKHEQGHFDICEIYARLLRKEIRQVKTLDEARLLYDKISNDENLEQDNFDNENHFDKGGIIPKWQQSVKERLEALKAYENPVVVVPMYK